MGKSKEDTSKAEFLLETGLGLIEQRWDRRNVIGCQRGASIKEGRCFLYTSQDSCSDLPRQITCERRQGMQRWDLIKKWVWRSLPKVWLDRKSLCIHKRNVN